MKFWMLYARGASVPSHRYETKEAALTEAERLIRERGRQEVFVLEVVGRMEPKARPVRYTPICS